MFKIQNILITLCFIVVILAGCNRDYVPKPRGYFRIDLPEHEYQSYNQAFPYDFEHSAFSIINVTNPDSCWLDIIYPNLNGKIHVSYKKLTDNLAKYLDETHLLAYKHSTIADAIYETRYENRENSVYGILYDIKGNVASSVQFFVTDSVENFLRGALYFNVRPNIDSLSPVINHIKEDIIYMIESLKWN
ncbi:gliding motility lipoprotein GldD [Bacteroidota bacterium]